MKGYPIGSFILWKTKDRLRAVRNIGNVSLPDSESGDYVYYVLDGQQRMTTLYAAVNGIKIIKDAKEVDYSEIYIDLNALDDEEIVKIEIDENKKDEYIKVVDLLNNKMRDIIQQYDARYRDIIETYTDRLKVYDLHQLQ